MNKVVHVGSWCDSLRCGNCGWCNWSPRRVLIGIAVIYHWFEGGWEVWNGMYPTIFKNVLVGCQCCCLNVEAVTLDGHISFTTHGHCEHRAKRLVVRPCSSCIPSALPIGAYEMLYSIHHPSGNVAVCTNNPLIGHQPRRVAGSPQRQLMQCR